MGEGRVEDIYRALKDRAVSFALRPGDRINEGALARELGASRTPLREALNRLVAERLVEFKPGAGFFCRGLDARAVFELYELRRFIEVGAVQAAAERAADEDLETLWSVHHGVDGARAGLTVGRAVAEDEAFHLDIARLTGNAVLLAELTGVNERIRFIRWIDMAARVATTKGEHRAVIEALVARDPVTAAAIMSTHIERRMDQVLDAVRQGITSIYMDEAEALAARPLEEA
ncbi:MAG: GntR family transcriptional regulator [Pseudomonadota bacterium]